MKRLSLLASLTLLSFGVAKATTIGLSDSNPLGGDPSVNPNIGYAYWDSFTDLNAGTGVTLTSEASDYGDSDYISATLSGSLTGGGSVTGSGDRIYNGAGPASVAFNLTIDGTVSASIDSISLQIKMSTPDVSTGLNRTSFFTVTLNGLTANAVVETNSNTGEVINGQTYGVVTYYWSGLDLEASDAFNLSITSPNSGHASVDGIRVDASAVPEPSTYALMALGLGLIAWKARRRFAKQA